MKKALQAVGVLLWLGGGIALIVLGMVFANNVVLFTGIGVLFGGGFLIAVGMLIAMFLRARKKLDHPETREQRQKREETSGKRASSMDDAENAIAATMAIWRLSGAGDKIKGTLFLVAFLTCCVLFVVFSSIGKIKWGLIAWGCGMGMMVIALVIVTIKDKVSARKRRKAEDGYCACKGRVLACELQSDLAQTGREIYEVWVEAEGRRVSCIAFRPYNEGELLDVKLNKEKNICVISK